VYALIEDIVADIPIGARGVIYLPYLNTAGINSPFSAPNARASFFGFSIQHTRKDLMRAVYDGTALAMRDCYEAFSEPAEEIFLVGGGSRSTFWSQLLSDAIERKITITEGTEVGARGVAMLAGIGVGLFDTLDEAVSKMVRVKETFEPNKANSQAYKTTYNLYRHLYLQARDSWDMRSDLLERLQDF
jgi:sugar (pentulose or hexulose) kinase